MSGFENAVNLNNSVEDIPVVELSESGTHEIEL